MLLDGLDLRSLKVPGLARSLDPVGLAIGNGPNALEIAVLRASARPTKSQLRDAWSKRWAGRASPVVVAVSYANHAALCGPTEPDPPVHFDIPVAEADLVCRAALAVADRHVARSFLAKALRGLATPLGGGLRNEGLFATHHLVHNLPKRPDWDAAKERGARVRELRDRALLDGLGFEIEPLPTTGLVLKSRASKVALAILAPRGTDVEAPSPEYNGLSAVSYGLVCADRENLPYVLVLEGATMRLHATRPGIGVGGRGTADAFVEASLDVLAPDRAAYLWLLFSAEALARGGTTEEALRQSKDYAAHVGTRLRDRIYDDVVPCLARGMAEAMQVRNDAEQLRETYEIALLQLFRMLFIAYGEDCLLLPYEANEQYRSRSLKAKARELAERARAATADGWDDQPTYQREVQALVDAVDKGKPAWGVSAYNGGLFSSERDVSPRGAICSTVELPDTVMGPVLRGLLVDDGPEGLGPVDFRSLSVRDFGTIYEGLLESDLAVAETDLTVDADGAYRPVRRASDEVKVPQGDVYLRNRSGARKASGSYFTKPFVVDHLIAEALRPALAEHVARLDGVDEPAAAEAFFDFRVVDLAMGSGHFLVAAVDEIARALSGYLARRPLGGVMAEITRLRAVVVKEVEKVGAIVAIEDMQLLRRQIARRCVYGVDLNPMSVELARLSLWIHTFVPGLPLSFLGHTLVRGNSLVGVATIDEAAASLGGDVAHGQMPLFGVGIRRMLDAASQDLTKLGRLADADRAEIEEARLAHVAARKKIDPLAAAFDYVTASRISPELRSRFEAVQHPSAEKALAALSQPKLHALAKEALAAIPPLHFPISFPEVFLRERAGFDVILGNPPWEEVTLERDRFWGRHIPGLGGVAQREREKAIAKTARTREDLVRELELEQAEVATLRSVLLSSGYAGMGTGDPDLYKAFVWRFWHLAAQEGGRIGVVLPRTALQAKGGAEFRRQLFADGELVDITFLLNTGGWVFDDAEPRYTIALTTLRRTTNAGDEVPLRGPYSSLSRFLERSRLDGATFGKAEVLGWTDTAALPLLPSDASAKVFAQLRKAPRLDRNVPGEWRARPYAEFHATNDKVSNGGVIDVTSVACPRGSWPVFKGESFDIWEPDTGSHYGWANAKDGVAQLERRRRDGLARKGSPFGEFGRADALGIVQCKRPRIAFRDVSRATDTRTVRIALVPPEVFLTNKAPYLLWPRGDESDEAYLLGVLASRPLDWYARRFVEVSLNYHIFNPFPVPRPARSARGWKRVVALAGRLACPDQRFSKFAAAVSVDHGPLESDEKADMIRELDAVVAHLYGLDAAQVRHVFETFHEGWDYEEDLRATLAHFAAWRSKERA